MPSAPDRQRIAYTMSRVRSSGSEIERRLGRALWAAGLRYRKQYPIFGKPDFALVSARIAIFCDSDFWHGYRWGEKRRREHKSNQAYWFAKIERNRKRDRLVNQQLRAEGWRVLRFWEHDLKADLAGCVAKALALKAASAAPKPKTSAPKTLNPEFPTGNPQ
jgi:DNA mismatch endonuclease (patch repair protein)